MWIELTEPARRHLCELCFSVFSCHLCEIDWVHPVHEVGLKNRQVYVCLGCTKKKNWIGVMTITSERIGNTIRLYDYKNGKCVEQGKFHGSKFTLAVWRSELKLPDNLQIKILKKLSNYSSSSLGGEKTR